MPCGQPGAQCWVAVSVMLDGKVYEGLYIISRGMVTVASVYGTKAAPIGDMAAHVVAKLLLSKLVQESGE